MEDEPEPSTDPHHRTYGKQGPTDEASERPYDLRRDEFEQIIASWFRERHDNKRSEAEGGEKHRSSSKRTQIEILSSLFEAGATSEETRMSAMDLVGLVYGGTRTDDALRKSIERAQERLTERNVGASVSVQIRSRPRTLDGKPVKSYWLEIIEHTDRRLESYSFEDAMTDIKNLDRGLESRAGNGVILFGMVAIAIAAFLPTPLKVFEGGVFFVVYIGSLMMLVLGAKQLLDWLYYRKYRDDHLGRLLQNVQGLSVTDIRYLLRAFKQLNLRNDALKDDLGSRLEQMINKKMGL